MKKLLRTTSFAALFTAASPMVSAATVAHYRFEEGVGPITSATDSSGNGNTLSNSGAPNYGTAVAGPVVNPGGLANAGSASLSGGAYLQDANPTTSVLGTTSFLNFTIEGMVNFGATLEGVESIVGKTETATGAEAFRDGFYLNKFFGNQFRLEAATVGGNYITVESGATLAATNTWYHVAAVGDSVAGTLSLYVNYNLVGSATGFDGLFVADAAAGSKWLVGAAGINNNQIVDQLNGSVDEVRFSDTALVPSEFLTAVPEPSTSLALLSGLGLLGLRRRR
ncbi:MAG: LamG-like jellyroll fold domain-containing protein [Luteolibacter sp.]